MLKPRNNMSATRTIQPIHRTVFTKVDLDPASVSVDRKLLTFVPFLELKHEGPRPAFAPNPKLNCGMRNGILYVPCIS